MAKKKQTLTLKQRKFLKYYMETGNKTEAARRAGYKCEASGRENMQKPLLRQAFQALMDKYGLTDEKLITKVLEGLDADVVVTATHEGEITDEKTYTDYKTRKAYAQLAAQLMGHLDNHVDTETTAGGELVQIIIKHPAPVQPEETEDEDPEDNADS